MLGNEVKGVQQSVVDQCDGCIEIPQYGTKHSLNVSVTAGIIMWTFFDGEKGERLKEKGEREKFKVESSRGKAKLNVRMSSSTWSAISDRFGRCG